MFFFFCLFLFHLQFLTTPIWCVQTFLGILSSFWEVFLKITELKYRVVILSFKTCFCFSFFNRKFAVQCLESKFIPILAGIIAFIDTNRNLDILSSSNDQEWKIGIWLQIFNNPDLTPLKYSLMVSPSRQELQEIVIKTTSVDGNVFSALMPFSWLIFGQIDEVLRKTIESKDKQGYFFYKHTKTWMINWKHFLSPPQTCPPPLDCDPLFNVLVF